jgi:hypothetical protein
MPQTEYSELAERPAQVPETSVILTQPTERAYKFEVQHGKPAQLTVDVRRRSN